MVRDSPQKSAVRTTHKANDTATPPAAASPGMSPISSADETFHPGYEKRLRVFLDRGLRAGWITINEYKMYQKRLLPTKPQNVRQGADEANDVSTREVLIKLVAALTKIFESVVKLADRRAQQETTPAAVRPVPQEKRFAFDRLGRQQGIEADVLRPSPPPVQAIPSSTDVLMSQHVMSNLS